MITSFYFLDEVIRLKEVKWLAQGHTAGKWQVCFQALCSFMYTNKTIEKRSNEVERVVDEEGGATTSALYGHSHVIQQCKSPTSA